MKNKNIINPIFVKLCIINFVMMLGQNMTNTLTPKYADYLGANAVMVGMVTSIFALSSLFIKPFSGQMIDSFNRKKILFYSIIVIAIAFTGYGLSTSIIMLLFFRLLHGCGLAFTVIGCLTMVSDTLPKEKLTSGIAYYTVSGAIAQAIGPSFGLYLYDIVGYQYTFFISVIIMCLSAVITLSLNYPNQKGQPFHLSLNNIYAKEAVLPAIIMFFLASVYITISSYLVLFAESMHVKNIALFFTVNAIALLFTRPLIGRLSDKIGTLKTLPIAIVAFALSMIMISFSTNTFMFIIASIINAFGYGACQPLIQSLCIKSVTPDRRGAASATSYYGTDFGYLFGPIIAGNLVEYFGYAGMFRTMPIMLVFALIILYVFKNKIKAIEMLV